jgi:peptide/nickel transport system substrate-binding protein
MKHVLRYWWGALLLILVVMPVLAQEGPGPGEGGVIIEPNLGSDVATLNPLLSNDQASNDTINRMYIGLIGYDPATQIIQPGTKGALATSWDVSEDGLTYTFHLRDDMTWTDGTPITSADYKYGFDAIASGVVDTPLGYVLDVIESVEAPDPYTVVVNFHAADCTAINNAGFVPIVPAHVFTEMFGDDFAAMNDSPYNIAPTVTSGVFSFGEFRPGEQVSVVANQNFPDTELGYVAPAGWIYKNVPDETLMLEQFLAGELHYTKVTQARQAEFRELAETQGFQIYEYPDTGFTFIGLNAADPTNPQNGLDENGDPIDQGHHPLFGDVRVRQALTMALDMEAILDGAANGEGTLMSTHANPTSWSYDSSIEPFVHDVDAALALLAEAGWVDHDNDPSTPLIAQGAPYAEDGTEFRFELLTNAGNNVREAVGTIVQDQLAQIGIAVDFQAIDFNVLVDNFVGQTYDAVILGWGFSFPDNPDDPSANFTPQNDIVGGGFNATSYNNPEVTRLLEEARTVPGCAPEDRAPLYAQVQQILHEEVPWIWLFQDNIMWVAQPNLQNWSPYPGHEEQVRWNLDAQYLTE